MKKGLTILFTGLPGSGKSTLAQALQKQLPSAHLIDGDILRSQNTPLGFTQKDRETQLKRAGEQALNIVKTGEIAICALIAPYQKNREWLRNHITQYGHYFETYISTPLKICEKRDPKGLYKKARNNEIPHFTGISDPYEIPQNPDLIINTHNIPVTTSIQKIINKLQKLNYT